MPLCALPFFLPIQAISANLSMNAHELVSKTLSDLGAGRDVQTISTITVDGREIIQDLVENDHPLTAPFYTRSASVVRRADDFDRQIERNDVTNGASVSTSLLSHDVSVVVDRKEKGALRQIGAAPPSWIVRNPIAALRLAARSNDLTLQPDVPWHGPCSM
jgi:hypothetical protein